MAILITHMSALDFWRRVYPIDKRPDPSRCCVPQGDFVSVEEAVWTSVPSFFTPDLLKAENGCLHVTVCHSKERRCSSTVTPHLWQGPFPDNAFYRLNDEAYIASPQFAYVQMARTLSLVQLIALGDELCGTYSFDESDKYGARQREIALIGKSDLMKCVRQVREDLGALYGTAKAERALEFIVEGSASPRETAIEMFLSLPYRMGGYALPKPLMNYEIPLDPEPARIARRKGIRADIYFLSIHFDLEYNGEDAHDGEAAHLSDRSRAIALKMMEIDSVEMTKEQLDNLPNFEAIAMMLAKKLGKRIVSNKKGALPQRVALRNEVFSWNKAYGRPT